MGCENVQNVNRDIGGAAFDPADVVSRYVRECAKLSLGETHLEPLAPQVLSQDGPQRHGRRYAVNRCRAVRRLSCVHRIKGPGEVGVINPLPQRSRSFQACADMGESQCAAGFYERCCGRTARDACSSVTVRYRKLSVASLFPILGVGHSVLPAYDESQRFRGSMPHFSALGGQNERHFRPIGLSYKTLIRVYCGFIVDNRGWHCPFIVKRRFGDWRFIAPPPARFVDITGLQRIGDSSCGS